MAKYNHKPKEDTKTRLCAKCGEQPVIRGKQFCAECEQKWLTKKNLETCTPAELHPGHDPYNRACAIIDETTGKECGRSITVVWNFVCPKHYKELKAEYGEYKDWPLYIKSLINAKEQEVYHERKHRRNTFEPVAENNESDGDDTLEDIAAGTDDCDLIWGGYGYFIDDEATEADIRRLSRLSAKDGNPAALFKGEFTYLRAWELLWADWCRGHNQKSISSRWGIDRRTVYRLVLQACSLHSKLLTDDGSTPEQALNKMVPSMRAMWPGRFVDNQKQLPPGQYKPTDIPGISQINNYHLPEPKKPKELEPDTIQNDN